jgi:tetraacyldisaccharide 4'-kinase
MGMKIIKGFLFPFAIIYGLIVMIRNTLFDSGILKEHQILKPSIGVGNLSSGGTGKSVVVDYLICLLKEKYSLVVLSRGYKRNTKGVVVGSHESNAASLGDEPFQFMKKHPEISVVVAEKRVLGIQKIDKIAKKDSVILLDDVMQHRYVKPSLMILTSTFETPYFSDQILPLGSLRESKKGSKRADIILITKCPENMKQEQIHFFKEKLSLEKHQQLFFTSIGYSTHIQNTFKSLLLDKISNPFLLITGIAEPKPLLVFLNEKQLIFEHLSYPDHHNFNSSDIAHIQKRRGDKMILTTEKDYTRLSPLIEDENVYYLPIKMEFINHEDQILFDKTIQNLIKLS